MFDVIYYNDYGKTGMPKRGYKVLRKYCCVYFHSIFVVFFVATSHFSRFLVSSGLFTWCCKVIEGLRVLLIFGDLTETQHVCKTKQFQFQFQFSYFKFHYIQFMK